MSKALNNIAIFASGKGSNAQKIIQHFKNSDRARVTLVVSGNPNAGVLDIARESGISTYIIDKQTFASADPVIGKLKEHHIDLVVLAGFLWLMPAQLIAAWPGRIINIHPALLPEFGGAGMYGKKVFEAVHAAGATESGITIHYVDEIYDHGKIIFQQRFNISPDDTPLTIAQKTQELEHLHFPRVIEEVLFEPQRNIET